MCGRFVLSSDGDRLADHCGLATVPAFTSGYNIAPSAQVPVVRRHAERELALCHWGFIPHWVKDVWENHAPFRDALNGNPLKILTFRDMVTNI